MNVGHYSDEIFARPALTARRCWEAEPWPWPPHVGCGGCGERFDTLTEFEQHTRAQELAAALAVDGRTG